MKARKLFSVIVMAAMLPMTTVKADPLPLNLQVRYEDPMEGMPFPRTPIQVPSIGIEDHTLYFNTPCDGCELRLIDGDGEEVYTTIIPTPCASLVLPTSLSGEYELQIIQGAICFYTIIEL